MYEADAREAVRMENGGLLKGNKLGIYSTFVKREVYGFFAWI